MNIHKELEKLERLYDKGLDKAYLKREYAGFFAVIIKTLNLKTVSQEEKPQALHNSKNKPVEEDRGTQGLH